MALSPFDAVIRFERGVPMLHMTQAREPELMSA
jgi:hypothetical protein